MAAEESTGHTMLLPSPEKDNPAVYSPHVHEEYVEYTTLGLIIVGLISVGILVIGLGIFLKYVLDSRATLRRLSISSQYSQTHKGRPTNHLPTVPSGVMLLPPDADVPLYDSNMNEMKPEAEVTIADSLPDEDEL